MQEIFLDTLKLHDLSDSTNPYHIEPPIKGLGYADVRIGSNPRSGDDGIRVTSSYLGERRVALQGKITGAVTAAEHAANRQALIAATAPRRDSNGVITLKTLRFKDLTGAEYRLLGEVIPSRIPVNHPRHSSFNIDFLAHSRFIEAFVASTTVVTTLTRGGFVLPFDLPVEFDAGSGGVGTAINNGDAPAAPVITLDGPLTNPRVTNTTTGEFLALTISLTDGQKIVINMEEQTIVQGGVTNRMSAKTAGNFWELVSGTNTIKLTTSVAGEAGTATFVWRDAFYGI